MRSLIFAVLLGSVTPTAALAQGNTRDFDRAGPAKEREVYFAQVRHEVNNVLLRWQRAWERDDAAALAALYADGASYFPASGEPAATRTAIRAHFARVLADVGNVRVQMIDFGTSGDLAYVAARASYHVPTDAGSSREAVFTDLLVLGRRADGTWQIRSHLSREEPTGPADAREAGGDL